MSKPANKAERAHMGRVAALGCIAGVCGATAMIHHCGTYMGGGRNHMRVLPLCWHHHQGPDGIDGKKISKRQWEARYGTEEELLDRVDWLLRESPNVFIASRPMNSE